MLFRSLLKKDYNINSFEELDEFRGKLLVERNDIYLSSNLLLKGLENDLEKRKEKPRFNIEELQKNQNEIDRNQKEKLIKRKNKSGNRSR